MPTYAPLLLLSVGALLAGFLIGWVRFRLRTKTEFVPLAEHREHLVTMRRRYGRRLRTMRELVRHHQRDEEQLRSEAAATATHQTTQDKLLMAAQAEIANLRERIVGMEDQLRARGQSLSELRAEVNATAKELCDALEKIAGFERDTGLLRIERDELAAQTQRLRTLPAAAPESLTGMPDTDQPATPATVATRAELADRNERIHELECQLRESRSRATELESSLQTWKYRIAPLALHMKKMQKDRERASAKAQTVRPARSKRDDLTRISGIGRNIQKKLHAEGVTRFAQLADMSPAELANLAIRAGIAASRPQQERWAEQARELRTSLCAPPLVS